MWNYATVCEFIPEIMVSDVSGDTKVMWNCALMCKFLRMHQSICEELTTYSYMDIEDVVQELLISVLGAEASYSSERGASPRTYAWRLCENRLIDMQRRQHNRWKSSTELHFDFAELQNDRTYETPAKFSSRAAVTADVVRACKVDEEPDTMTTLDLSTLLAAVRSGMRHKQDFDKLISMLLTEHTQEEIAAAFQMTQPSISLKVSKLRKEFAAHKRQAQSAAKAG